ncbi:MAG: glutaminase [Homoserinimonas sp.]
MDVQGLLDDIRDSLTLMIGQGDVADYIPSLAGVHPAHFGMAVVMQDGETFGTGDWEKPFSIQSISKLFTLAMAYAVDGDALWQRVSREPSGDPFNSLAQLELQNGIPRNPFVNSGALVVADRLLSESGGVGSGLLAFLRTESGNDSISANPDVAASEAEHGFRNAAIANLLASFGNLDNSVPEVLEEYFWQCSVEASCRDLATAGGLLTRGGTRADGTRMLSPSEAKRINAIMLTCGTYDAAGEFAYRVGLPAKSGVGGGILAVVPGRCTICVWSPGLDAKGNSLVGTAALDEFTTRTGWSIF